MRTETIQYRAHDSISCGVCFLRLPAHSSCGSNLTLGSLLFCPAARPDRLFMSAAAVSQRLLFLVTPFLSHRRRATPPTPDDHPARSLSVSVCEPRVTASLGDVQSRRVPLSFCDHRLQAARPHHTVRSVLRVCPLIAATRKRENAQSAALRWLYRNESEVILHPINPPRYSNATKSFVAS